MSKRQEIRKQSESKKRNFGMLFAAVVLVLLAGYLVSGMMVKKDQIIAGVYVNGVDVGGMSVQKAAQAVQGHFQKVYQEETLRVHAVGNEYAVKMYDSLAMDADKAAREAYAYGHGNFFARGFCLLKAELFKEEFVELPYLADEAALKAAVDASGLTGINTTIQTTYEVTKKDLIFTKGVTGVSVDSEKLTEALKKAVKTAAYETVIECPMVTGAVSDMDVQAIYDQIHTKKANATLNPKNDYKIVKSVRGVSFDVEQVKAQLGGAAEGEKVVIPLTIKQPKITTKNLKKHLFKDVLGSCTTNVGGTNARVSNVALAAKELNGTILLPGESFSYNDVVGERTADRGFQKAPAYSNGSTVQELGGGICQVSSTLYKATLLSNLKIVEHRNHSYVSSYIGIGMDATVSWGGPDFRFKNNTDYPIKISAGYSGGQVTCKILGANIDKIKVEMTAETLKVNDYGTVYQDDSSLEKGQSVVSVVGETGYVVQTYRKIYNKKGKLISNEKEAYCVYTKRDQVIRVGTKEPEPVTQAPAEETTQAQAE